MAQRTHDVAVTLRCPVCNTPRTATLPRNCIDTPEDEPHRRGRTPVRCAACGEASECYDG